MTRVWIVVLCLTAACAPKKSVLYLPASAPSHQATYRAGTALHLTADPSPRNLTFHGWVSTNLAIPDPTKADTWATVLRTGPIAATATYATYQPLAVDASRRDLQR